jgi:Fe-S-cluster containining protein
MGDVPQDVVARINLTVSGQPIETEITLPNRPVRPVQMVPLFSRFAELVVDSAVKVAQAEGKQVSCKAGCGACCRQLVPLSEMEAVHIAQILYALPTDRHQVVQARFQQGRAQLAQAGLLEQLKDPTTLDADHVSTFGLDYFAQGIPCPFLEDESCSIHEVRPISCREYLVTSPAEHCVKPTAGTVQCVPLGLTVSKAVKSLAGTPTGPMLPWVPLILADEWAANYAEPPARLAPELLQLFLERVREQQQPAGR